MITHGFACLAKTDAAVMPATLAALEMCRGLGAGTSLRGLLGNVGLRTLPFALVSAGATRVALRFMADRVVTSPIDLGGPLDRLLAAGWAIWLYVQDTVWPVQLAAAYPMPRLPVADWSSWLPLAGIGGCLAAASATRRHGGLVLAIAAAAFVAMLLPVLFIVPQGYFRFSLVADRYLHLPLLVPASLVAAGLAAVAARVELLRIALVTGDRSAVDAMVAEVRADAGRPQHGADHGEQFERLLALGIAALAPSPTGKPMPAAGRTFAVARAAATTDVQRARAEAWAQAAGSDTVAGVAGGAAAALRSLRRLAADQPHLRRVVGQEALMLERLIREADGGL